MVNTVSDSDIPEQELGDVQVPMPRSLADDSLNSLRYQLDNTEIVDQVEQILRCRRPVVNADFSVTWEDIPNTTPLLSEQGIQNIRILLTSRLTKIFTLSDLEDHHIKQIVNIVDENLTDDFFLNWDEYQIKDVASASHILNLVTDTIHGTLRKGHKGNYLKLLRHIHTIHDNHSGAGVRVEKRQGWGDRVMDMLRKK